MTTPAPAEIARRPSAFSAVRWILATSFVTRLLGLAGLAAVARLVSEDGFGAYRALASLHLVGLAVLPLGFDQLVVREASRRRAYAQGLVGALVAMAVACGAVVLLAHPLLAEIMGLAGERATLLWFVPLVLAIQALKTAIKPVLAAELAFRRIGFGEFLQTLTLWFGGLGLLAVLPETWALYVAFAAAEAIEAWFLWRGRWKSWGAVLARPRQTARRFRALLRRHRRFCGVLAADQGLNIASAQAPALLLGGLIGPAAVAAFSSSNFLITLPLLLLVGALGRVVFPSLSGLSEDDLRARVYQALRGSAAFIAPFLIWLALFSATIVRAVLGPEWAEAAAPLVPWLAMYLLFVGVFSPISSLDVLRDRPEVGLFWNIAAVVLRAGAIVLGARWGVEGAIAAFAVVSAALWMVHGALMGWLLGEGQARFHAAWLRYVPLWMAVGGAWWATRWLAGEGWLALALSPVAAAGYFGALWLLDRETAGLGLRLLRRK
ncbi:MAG: oligosaccharide flippase family protein [Sumerlaeia bacterium]